MTLKDKSFEELLKERDFLLECIERLQEDLAVIKRERVERAELLQEIRELHKAGQMPQVSLAEWEPFINMCLDERRRRS